MGAQVKPRPLNLDPIVDGIEDSLPPPIIRLNLSGGNSEDLIISRLARS